mmetsp:Transcript_2145/g.9525  ORF Transcript_2145/g.9525 Transcript_2145/m.9525 type:complete len:378 (+) Transcript_2145:1953-3086(+)
MYTLRSVSTLRRRPGAASWSAPRSASTSAHCDFLASAASIRAVLPPLSLASTSAGGPASAPRPTPVPNGPTPPPSNESERYSALGVSESRLRSKISQISGSSRSTATWRSVRSPTRWRLSAPASQSTDAAAMFPPAIARRSADLPMESPASSRLGFRSPSFSSSSSSSLPMTGELGAATELPAPAFFSSSSPVSSLQSVPLSPGDGGAGPSELKMRENAANGLRQFMWPSPPPFAPLKAPADASSSSMMARRTSMITRTHSAWPLIAAACSAVPPATASVDRDPSTAKGSAPCASKADATVCRPARAAAMSGLAPSENSTLAPAPHRRRDETTAPAPASPPRRRAAGEKWLVGDRSCCDAVRSARCLVAISRGVRPE